MIAITIGDQYLTLLWVIIVAIVGGIVWLIRLEGTTKANTRDIERMQRDFNGGIGRISQEVKDSELRLQARLERMESYLLSGGSRADR